MSQPLSNGHVVYEQQPTPLPPSQRQFAQQHQPPSGRSPMMPMRPSQSVDARDMRPTQQPMHHDQMAPRPPPKPTPYDHQQPPQNVRVIPVEILPTPNTSTVTNGYDSGVEISPSGSRQTPSNASQQYLNVIPLQQGLLNHGNTCYMNAIVQCLANCNARAEYLVSDQYVDDAKSQTASQQRNARKFGSDLTITRALAQLMQVNGSGVLQSFIAVALVQHVSAVGVEGVQDGRRQVLERVRRLGAAGRRRVLHVAAGHGARGPEHAHHAH